MQRNHEKIKPLDAGAAYRLAIFDVDGTLVDSFPLFVQLLNRYASKYRYQILDEERVEYLRAFAPREIRKELGLTRLQALRLAIDCKRAMQTSLEKPKLFAGVEQLLIELKNQGFQLAIVTSNSLENCRMSLGEDCFALFEWIQPNASIYGKQRLIKKVLGLSRCEPTEAIYIGDQIADINSAYDLNMHVAAVTWGFNNAKALAEAKPTYLCQSVEQLANSLITHMD